MAERSIELTVKQWLKYHPVKLVAVAPATGLLDIVKVMLQLNARDAYVVENNQVLGHLSFTKLVNHIFSEERPVRSHRQLFAHVAVASAVELMDPHFAYCREQEIINQILHRQLQSDVSDLVVLGSDDAPVGVIKLTDVVQESLK